LKTVGIICEYNPFHFGHSGHIEKTREIIRSDHGCDVAVVCVMSGNFVQRGDFAVFNKQSRAKMAILGGADLVIEMPTPYVLQSAEGFAKAGVYLLEKLGVCDYISFGSESGDVVTLRNAAQAIVTETANQLTKQWLETGISYALAQQKAANVVMGVRGAVFNSPNNVLGIEYIKALNTYASQMVPITIERTGGQHDSDVGYSASAVRKQLLCDAVPMSLMPDFACDICAEEIASGRGPISINRAEQAILSRLRAIDDYSAVPNISEGLEKRFKRYATTEASIVSILTNVKTKRYTMARIRRILMCAVLGITLQDTAKPPPYIRVLAMNTTGMKLLSKTRTKAKLPIIAKPASVYELNDTAIKLFNLEASATDFYVLAYPKEEERKGAQEWRLPPVVVRD
jgi:predicted nucleotidyltransferase